MEVAVEKQLRFGTYVEFQSPPGGDHTRLIWDMVAFIRQLPKMKPDQYKVAVASTPEDHDEIMEDMTESR